MTKREVVILISVGLLVLLLYAFAGFFAHPSLDDFVYASKGRDGDFLNTVLNEREIWNGRYISNFIVLFSPLNWGGMAGYKLMPLVLIAFTLFGTYLFFKTLIHKCSFTLAMIATLITFSILPDITEGLYWFTGAFTYIPSGVLFLYILSIGYNHYLNINYSYLLLAIFLSIIACGFNEIIPILGVTIFAYILVVNKNKKGYSIIFLFIYIFLLYYVITAPGNTVRSGYFTNKHQLFYSLFYSSLYTIRFIGEWLLNPAFAFWLLLLLKLNFDSNTTKKLYFLKQPFTIIVALIIPTYISCFGPIWSTGLLGQYRTANLACFFFAPTFTLIVIANKEYLLQKLKFFNRFRYGFVCLLVSILIWGNQFSLFKEIISGDLLAFNEQMYKRYELIENCKQEDCYLPEITTKSDLLFAYPLVESPNNYHNLSYQIYFNSGKIHLINP